MSPGNLPPVLRNNRSPCQQSPPRTPAPLFRLPAPQEQGVSLPEPRLSGTQDPGLSSAPSGNPGPWELRCPEPWAPRTLAASSSRSPAPQLPTLPGILALPLYFLCTQVLVPISRGLGVQPLSPPPLEGGPSAPPFPGRGCQPRAGRGNRLCGQAAALPLRLLFTSRPAPGDGSLVAA